MTYKHACITGVLALSLLTFSACSDDNEYPVVDNEVPTFAVTADHVMTDNGRDVHFAGKITDADGISKITITCPDLGIDKTIDIIDIFKEPLTEYELDYKFRMRNEFTAERYDVLVTVYDIAGNKTEQNILITMDGDFAAPVFEIAPGAKVSILMSEEVAYTLRFTVRDNRVLDYVTVDVEGVEGYPVTIDGNGRNRIEYAELLALPAEEATYNVTITAADKAAQDGEVRTTVIESVLSVAELADWDDFYISDVKTPEELNSDVFGVPMRMDHVGEFKYRVRYYNAAAGTEIRFLPQQTDFDPICFAPSKENPEVLGNSTDTTNPLVLNESGVYYVFDVNTLEGTYSYKTYPVSEALSPLSNVTLGANDMNTWSEYNNADVIWWQELKIGPATDPGSVSTVFEQDRNNPNLLILDNWKLEAGGMNYCIMNWHSHGWWDFYSWKVDNDVDPSKCVYYGNYHAPLPASSETGHAAMKGNGDFLTWKYTEALTPEEFEFMYPEAGNFSLGSWGNTDWRNKVTYGNWIHAVVPAEGTYRLVLDVHTEHLKLLPVE